MFPMIGENAAACQKRMMTNPARLGFIESIRWLSPGMVSSQPKGSTHSTILHNPAMQKRPPLQRRPCCLDARETHA